MNNPRAVMNLKPFKKGQSGNPSGRPKKIFTKIVEELKAAGCERVRHSMIIEAYELLLSVNEEGLKEIIADKSRPVIIRVVAKSMVGKQAFEIFEMILDRAHGKAKQPLAHTGEVKVITGMIIK